MTILCYEYENGTQMMKRIWFFLLLCTFIVSFYSCKKETSPLNVVVLFTDDQRFNTIHALGNEEIVTPNMDRLVRLGVSFTQAYVMGAHHGAVCAPSRAMLLTGRPYMKIPRTFVDQGQVPADTHFDFLTFPELLKKNGYTTFFTGKWHNHTSKIPESFTLGANLFIGGMHWPKDGGHRKPQLWDFDSTAVFDEKEKWQAEEFSSKMYSDAAISFIEGQNASEPFCLYVAYTSPHDPREAPDEFVQLYDPDQISLPENFRPQHPFDNGHLRTRDENLLPFPRTEEAVKKEIADYYAMISEVDTQIGRVLDVLEEKKLLDKTIIVFAGDNGLAVGQHGLLGKQNLYEHSIRVPLVIAAPGIRGDRKTPTLTYLYDIYPTICDLLGLVPPPDVEGESLLPALRNSSAQVRDHLFFAHAREMRAVRTADHWKLIRYFVNGQAREQLFKLDEDEWEMNNLAENPNFAGKKKELESLLLQNLHGFKDDFIRPFIHTTQATFDAPVKVSIRSAFPNGEVRYTLSGEDPNVSSPRYERPFILDSSVSVRAAVFFEGQLVGKMDSAYIQVLPNIQEVLLLPAPSSQYPGKGKITLLDGANGHLNLQRGNWLGFEGEDVTATIIFKELQPVSEVGIRFLNLPGSWIFPPRHIKVLVSENGDDFRSIADISDLLSSSNDKMGPQEIKVPITKQEIRFIKFEIKSQGICPDWHPGKGNKAWLFVDELFVE